MESFKKYRNLGFFILIAIVLTGCISSTAPKTKEDYFKTIYEGNEDFGYLYNGFAFLEDGVGGYITEISVKENKIIEIPLNMGPKNLTEVKASGWMNSSYFNKGKLYITFDPESENMQTIALSAAELSLNLMDGLGVIPIAACTKNTSVCEGRPIVTCDTKAPVIFLKNSNKTATITYEDNCITLEGRGDELLKSADYFLLKWYRIL